MESFFYTLLPSLFGTLRTVWHKTRKGLKVHRIFLPDKESSSKNPVQANFVDKNRLLCPLITELDRQIQNFLTGKTVKFDLNIIALDRCSEFQKRILLAGSNIPRGKLSTYGRIARSLGIPGSARAVGRALACNPFPVIIPCHRVIRSSGEPGKFQGGPGMKQMLLKFEGIEFSQQGGPRYALEKFLQ